MASERFGSWATLKASLLRIVHGAMSGRDRADVQPGARTTRRRRNCRRGRGNSGSLVARVSPGTVGLSGFRKQLDTFFGSYIAELQDRGFPIWHPLPFQVPDDREGALHADEFLLGDEMLVAPFYEPGDKRRVYLPRGNWTNLETNEADPGTAHHHRGNASLCPCSRATARLCRWMPRPAWRCTTSPRLGGEFFLLEGDIAEYSQVHAAPALDIMRLEIESKKDRDYQWVVHHVEGRPAWGSRIASTAKWRRSRRCPTGRGSTMRRRRTPRQGESEGGRGLHH